MLMNKTNENISSFTTTKQGPGNKMDPEMLLAR